MIRVEKFSEIKDELPELLNLHFNEVELHKEEIPLDFNYELYENIEKIGLLNVVTARVDGKLVGYIMTTVMPHSYHKDVLFGNVDMIFIKKENRGFLGGRLLVAHELVMRNMGVKKIMLAHTPLNSLESIFTKLGYTPIRMVYAKVL